MMKEEEEQNREQDSHGVVFALCQDRNEPRPAILRFSIPSPPPRAFHQLQDHDHQSTPAMETLDGERFDLVIAGTGIAESLLALYVDSSSLLAAQAN